MGLLWLGIAGRCRGGLVRMRSDPVYGSLPSSLARVLKGCLRIACPCLAMCADGKVQESARGGSVLRNRCSVMGVRHVGCDISSYQEKGALVWAEYLV